MTTYTDPFGGGTVLPSPVSYRELALTSVSTQLAWPGYEVTTEEYAAQLIDITSAVASAVVLMPPANVVSPGLSILFTNLSAQVVTLQDNAGGAIGTIAVGAARLVYLTSNATAAGAWRTVLYGVGTGSLDVGAAAGYGLQAVVAQLQANWPVTAASSSTSLTTAMRASAVAWTGGVGTLTLLGASAAGNGFLFAVRNQGTGILTVAAAGADTIDGAASIALQPQESATIYSDGTSAWYSVGRGRNQQFNFTLLIKGITGGTVTLTSTEAANVVQRYTGVLVSNAEVNFPSVVQVYYVSNQTSGAFTVTFRTAGVGTTVSVPTGQNAVLFCDGTNVINTSTTVSGLTALILSAGSVGAPSIAYSGDTSTGIYRPVAGSVGLVGNGGDVLRAAGVASGVNYLQITNAATGSHPVIAAQGADANINITLTPKGTGIVSFGGGAFAIPDGTEAAPGLAFAADLNTGLYRVGAEQIGISANGSRIALINTGGVQLILGSASAPSYSFTGDSNTGMYSSGANVLDWTVDGTRMLSLSITGLGIGGAAEAKLSLVNTDNGGIWIRQAGANQTGFLHFRDSDSSAGGYISYDHSSNLFRIATSDDYKLFISGDGDFGFNCTPVASIMSRFQDSGNNDIGIELARLSSTSVIIQSYDRTGGAYRTLSLDGSTVVVNTSGTARYSFGANSISPAATNTYNLGGTGAEWQNIYTRNLYRDSAGALTISANDAAGSLDLRVAGASALSIDSNRKSTFGGGAFTTTNSQSFTATPTFNANLSNVFELGTMTGNVTSCTITNPSNGQTIQIRVKQDATGGRTFAAPSGAKIVGSVGATASAASILTLTYSAADARWEGSWLNLPV